MSTLIITRGLPGSGKTTLAQAWVNEASEDRVRVNRDDLRGNLYSQHVGLSYRQEQAITTAQHAAVTALLATGKSVVVDDTNLRLRNARAWCDLALAAGVEFVVWDVDTTVDECVARDALRARVVGEGVIRQMHQRYASRGEVKPSERKADDTPLPYIADEALPTAWLIDVDGTLAHMGDRSPYDVTRVGEDTPDAVVIRVATTLRRRDSLIIMSGRSEDARTDTEAWLHKHLGEYTELHMRGADDNRADFKVKADLFDAHVRDRWNVLGVLDDRDQVVNMWRGMGLKCLQVAEGAF